MLAHHAANGLEAWRVDLAATGPLAADDDVVIVPVEAGVHALAAKTGETRWALEIGTVTAPPLLRGGWLILAAGGNLLALAGADGDEIWTKQTGLIGYAPAIDGATLYVSAADGRVLALDLESGSPRWETVAGTNPTQPFPFGDRVYLGVNGTHLLCLNTADGSEAWNFQIGAEIRGTASGDASHIYTASMDNLLRAFRRSSGARAWHKDLGYRPLSGPILIGSRLAVGGRTATMPLFDTSGDKVGELKLPDPAVVAPGFRRPADVSEPAPPPPDGPALAFVTGDPGRPYLLVLTGEPMPTIPAVTPLKVLPGEVLPPMTLPGS